MNNYVLDTQGDKNWKEPKKEEKVEKQKISLNGVIKEVDVIKNMEITLLSFRILETQKQ